MVKKHGLESTVRPRGRLKKFNLTPFSCLHYKSTTHEPFNKLNTGSPAGNCFQECVVEPSPANRIPDIGVQHVKLRVAVHAASQRFRDHLPVDPQWRDIVEAAAKIRVKLDISQKSWGEACQLLGRNGAALCILATDQGRLRTENHVRQPAAYFRGMLIGQQKMNCRFISRFLAKPNDLSPMCRC